ncbi:DNA ligase D [Luteimonas sp. RIT-PG2_3]
MSLLDYRRKRSFARTREPEPGKRVPRGKRAIFVVQLHHASRRHYDFRLQVGDALKSWAVPKGPSYDPAVKRMAVEVEDHPLDYAGFEGEIPKGEYGGGHVARFDEGVWSSDGDVEAQLAKGHLRFELFGRKLKGGWHLVRSAKTARQPQWLLFKDKDAYAGDLEADDLLADVSAAPAEDIQRAGAGKPAKKRRATVVAKRARRKDWTRAALALPGAKRAVAPTRPFAPQLATLVETTPQGTPWIHEIKWDGYRILALVNDGQVRLWSRNAIDWTDRLPDVRASIEALGLVSAALDGELIAGDGRRQDFNLLQATLSGERQATLAYVLFDVLHLQGVDVGCAPLLARKQLLQALLEGAPGHLAFSSHIDGDGEAAYRLAGERGFEGIVSKRGDRAYHGGRGDDWRKTKQAASDEFAVVGYTAPKGSRTGFGSLLLARPDGAGGWRYAGRVGSGFSAALMRELVEMLGDASGKRGSRTPSVQVDTLDTDLRGATWFAPRIVVEAFYRGIGRQGLLRQPSLKAVRRDKRVDDLLADADTVAPPTKGSAMKASTSTRVARTTRTAKTAKATKTTKTIKSAKTAKTAKRSGATTEEALPTLSSPTRIVFPDIRASKQDVWDYYRAVAPQLLPEIVGRPLSIIRCPAGAERPCFFQKHHTAGLERVARVRLKEDSGASGDYLVVEDLAGLMALVQSNALEFHPWGAHAREPDRADRVVFDLDPGPGVPFAEVKRAAVDIRKLLERLALTSFLRVSGGKGLHVVVPLQPGCDWSLTRRFAHGFADALARSEPDRFVASASKRLRHGRIFVDYLRNGRGATAVACYSLRARPGAPVAMPLAWRDLPKLARADAFTIQDVPGLLRRRRKDPWDGIDQVRQTLARWARQE